MYIHTHLFALVGSYNNGSKRVRKGEEEAKGEIERRERSGAIRECCNFN